MFKVINTINNNRTFVLLTIPHQLISGIKKEAPGFNPVLLINNFSLVSKA